MIGDRCFGSRGRVEKNDCIDSFKCIYILNWHRTDWIQSFRSDFSCGAEEVFVWRIVRHESDLVVLGTKESVAKLCMSTDYHQKRVPDSTNAEIRRIPGDWKPTVSAAWYVDQSFLWVRSVIRFGPWWLIVIACDLSSARRRWSVPMRQSQRARDIIDEDLITQLVTKRGKEKYSH